MRKKRPNPYLIDDENPEWTEKDWAEARPAREVLYEIFPKHVADELLKPRGRPKSEEKKVAISLRLPPKTLAKWKATGPGWQTRMAEKLAKL